MRKEHFTNTTSSVRAVTLSVLGAIAMLLVRVTDHGIRLQKKKSTILPAEQK